jgi:hypothetical protein
VMDAKTRAGLVNVASREFHDVILWLLGLNAVACTSHGGAMQ